ncbi:LysR family transcriptional regulator [Roseomonas sp. SSH11]|uniref:LysR family transcriptional regulator n=1 Tax=Pararoseomonas baculiformis TaxID=2820812 RepID=A0ABS4AGH7_9PROT|nr:LysR family transcriptional regulator [Pararoseomonas baculiformis]MBP0446129.1 LysR family transcriptional regulator [Pararoseomonas baculiformis]
MYDWGDLRFLLAVAEEGSTLSAARALGVNQTTVARRIAALEAALGLKLFDRRQDGYRPSEAGQALLAQAGRVREEAETLSQLASRHRRALAGVIRVTTTEGLANSVFTPWLADFTDAYPDIRVEMIADERRLDLARGEADIAIRATKAPEGAGIVARRIADAPWAVYCSRGYAARRGMPADAATLEAHVVIGADGALAGVDPFAWLSRVAPRAPVRTVCSSIVNMVFAIRAGNGLGPLPCAMAATEPELVECFPLPDFGYRLFLLTREELKDLPRIRAFNDFIVARAISMRDIIEGRPRQE